MGKPRRRAPRDRSDGDGDANVAGRKDNIASNPGNAEIRDQNSTSVLDSRISAHDVLAANPPREG